MTTALLVACADPEFRTSSHSASQESPAERVTDHPGFHFLPPLAAVATYGTFQAGLSPVVVVRQKETGAVIAAWSTTGGSYGTRITERLDQYALAWETWRSNLTAGSIYRITVGLAGETFELGAVDVRAVASGGKKDVVDVLPLVVGRDLPIRFRIDASAVYCLDAPACDTWCAAASSPDGTWRARAAPPSDSTLTAPYYIGAAAVSGKLHTIALQRLPVGGGNTFLKVATYDPALDAWSLTTGEPWYAGEGNWGFALAAVDQDLYRVAGFYDHAPTSSVSVYDEGSAAWQGAPPLAVARESLAATVSNGRIFAIGGDSLRGYTSDVESYAPASESSWSDEAPLPEARAALAATESGGKIYAIGGYTSSSSFSSLLEYDPGTKAWTSRAPMPTARSHLGAATFRGEVHAIGGYSSGGVSLAHEAYDPATGTWSIRAQMLSLGPTVPSWEPGAGTYAVAIGCHVYAIANGALQEYTAPGP